MNKLPDLLSSVLQMPQVWLSQLIKDGNSTVEELSNKLLSAQGEVSGFALAQEILNQYSAMLDEEKEGYFRYLAEDLDINTAEVKMALEKYQTEPSKRSYQVFLQAAEPKRQELIRRINQVPDATGLLVSMRKDLLHFTKKTPRLAVVDLDFRHLFTSWFNRGFLLLKPINWESSASVLEKIIEYEAVHEISSWSELRSRLKPKDRRCFAYFHPTMPDEPLIFVEVALTVGIPNSIQTLLSENREMIETHAADTAVFYSISNCQAGLAGISFGNSLIKHVVRELSSELPTLKNFITLSPIPMFRHWLEKSKISIDEADQQEIKKLAAHYLLSIKRKDGWPYDPVARFHLGNGALIHAVHAEADVSQNGKRQSHGAMVNYLYKISQISENHERFVTNQVITASSKVESLGKAVEKSSLQD